MKKTLGALFLAGAALVTYTGTTDTFAQGKKKDASGTVEIVESKDGKYRFTVRDTDGKYLGGSASPHATAKEAKEAVEKLKAALVSPTFVDKKGEVEKKVKKAS